jgi:hypothetical protein
MLSGIKEILIIVIVLLALFFVPRLLRKRTTGPSKMQQAQDIKHSNAGLMRLGLFLSVSWIVLAFILLNPFSGSWMPFVAGGVLPVAIGWGIRWVALGFK